MNSKTIFSLGVSAGLMSLIAACATQPEGNSATDPETPPTMADCQAMHTQMRERMSSQDMPMHENGHMENIDPAMPERMRACRAMMHENGETPEHGHHMHDGIGADGAHGGDGDQLEGR